MIDSKAVYRKELLIDSGFYARSKGFVKNFKIIKEWLDEKGLYHTRIKASVSDNLLEDELVRLLQKDRVIILTDSNSSEGANALEKILGSKFTKLGYKNVIARTDAKKTSTSKSETRPKSLNLSEARRQGIRYLADVVVFGVVKNANPEKIRDGYYSCQASGSVEVFKVKDKKLLSAVRKDSVRGFGDTGERASQAAVSNAGNDMADYIIKELTPGDYKVLKVLFYNIPSFTEFRKYKNLLSEMRWVNGVEEDSNGYNRLKTVFNVKYSEKPGFIASGLEGMKELKVLKASDSEIEVEVK